MIGAKGSRTRHGRIAIVLLCAVLAAGCGRDREADAQHPSARGGPLAVAGHMLAAQVAATSGNRQAARAQQDAASRQYLRDMRMPDPARIIDPEAARVAVAPLPGVRGVVWMDRSNLIVMVDGARYRSMHMIDRVCASLAPLGDTLGVVVNLQNVNAVSAAQADTLSRNCQLPPGQRAFLQPHRQIDALDPRLRRTFEAQQRQGR